MLLKLLTGSFTVKETMKKALTILSLSLAAATASAAGTGTSFGLVYDFDDAHSNSRGFNRGQEAKAFVAQETAFGKFDAGIIGSRFSGNGNGDNAYGYEVGYSNGLKYQGVGITGRVGFGRMNHIDPTGGGFTANSNYASFGLEAAVPVNERTNAFVGYRHRNAFGDDMFAQNRYTAGVDYALNKTTSVRAAVATARQAGLQSVGFTTGLTYSF